MSTPPPQTAPASRSSQARFVSVPPGAAEWAPLIQDLTADGFDGNALCALFTRPDARFDPSPMRRKLKELYPLLSGSQLTRQTQKKLIALGYTPGKADGRAGENTRRAIKAFQNTHGLPVDGEPSEGLLAAIEADLRLPESARPRPVETLVNNRPSTKLHKSYLAPARLAEARRFYQEHRTLLKGMERTYGVPGEVVVGILRVETHFGKYLGDKNAFNILASMALCRDFSRIEPYLDDLPRSPEARNFLQNLALEKGSWAYGELVGLLQYAQHNRQDPLASPGSIYGAIGICQFMPSNAVKYGADGDGDGKIDLFTMPDAIYSVGSYFKGHGWTGDMSNHDRRREVVFTYNHSDPYVNTVLAVADHVRDNR